MNYLKYIEHDAENLQFFLWARSYQERWDKLPEYEKKLSPEWTNADGDAESTQPYKRPMKVSADTAAALKGTAFDSSPNVTEIPSTDAEKANPFNTPPRTPSDEEKHHGLASEVSSTWDSTQSSTGNTSSQIKRKAEGAYDDAGLKWQPCK